MEKSFFKVRLMSAVLLAAGFVVSGCTDNDYDFNEIDTTVGIGGDGLEIPTSSTTVIPLKDVLELNEGGSVVEDAVSGDYVFRQDGGDVETVVPRIEKIIVAHQTSSSYDVTLGFSQASPAKRKARTAEGVIRAEGRLQAFSYEGDKPEEVIDLNNTEVHSDISLSIDFSDTRNVVNGFESLIISLPAFMELSNVSCGGQDFEMSGSDIILKNVSTASNLSITATITKLNFKNTDTSHGSLKIEGNKIKMDGQVHITAVASNGNIVIGGATSGKVTSVMTMGDFTVNAATGRFSPGINMNDLGDITVSDIPDFLQGGNVVVDLYNPQITLTVTSDMSIPGTVDGTINSYKNGQLIASVDVNGIRVEPNGTTNVLICRKDEGKSGYSQVIVKENLSDIIKTIPDRITFSATAEADQNGEYRFELGHDYHIKPSYSVDAPIAFAEDANIEYRDTIADMNEDIQDFELADGAHIEMSANVKSCVPAYLGVEAVPVDVNGNAISADELSVNVEGTIEASKDGSTETNSPLKITITQSQKGALGKLDGIAFTVSGKANGAGGAVTGITLNARKHTLVVEDIRIKLVGKVIGNFN